MSRDYTIPSFLNLQERRRLAFQRFFDCEDDWLLPGIVFCAAAEFAHSRDAPDYGTVGLCHASAKLTNSWWNRASSLTT
jgi:hypothetical protein